MINMIEIGTYLDTAQTLLTWTLIDNRIYIHHTLHLVSGFILRFDSHLNTREKSSEFASVPNTLRIRGNMIYKS